MTGKAVSCGLACVFGSIVFSGCNQQPQKPNILFIAVDDLRPELGCYGNSYVHSPNIDRLAANGITFMQAYCQSAVCNPSRASLMTGLRPNTTRVIDLNTDFRATVPEAVTLPQHLKNNGYHTAAIGKIYHNIFPDTLSWSEPKFYIKGYPFDPDAVYRGPESMAIQEQRKQDYIRRGLEKQRVDVFGEWYLKAMATECEDLPDNAYYDGAQTDVALEKLAEFSKTGKPFFFGIGFYRPHLPFNAPKKYWDLYNRDEIRLTDDSLPPVDAPRMALNNLRELRGYSDFTNVAHPFDHRLSEADARLLKHGYLASVSYIDAQIGRLLDQLEALGLDQNTIVVLWGDHGWKLGEKGSWCKMTNYGIDTRVPLIVSTPGLHGKGIKSQQLVEFVDIYPSLCELTGTETPATLEGKSFVPLLSQPDQPWKEVVYSQFYREGIWTAPDTINYNGYAARTKEFLYVEWYAKGNPNVVASELYDLTSDPNETVNLAGEPTYNNVIDDMKVKLTVIRNY